MRILFLTDNFPPETNAPASRTHEHAKRWAAAGHDVTVITCAPNFPRGRVFDGYANRVRTVETVDRIRVVRVKTFIARNSGFFLRTLDYLSFMVAGFVAALFERRPDVVVATSPQFFCAAAGWLTSVFKRRPFVFELRDIWPASIAAVGASSRTPILRALERLELFLYRRATSIVAVTHSFRDELVERGVPREKIHVVTNGVDLSRYAPLSRDAALGAELGLEGKFVVGYVGTHGMAHALMSALDAAARLDGRGNVHFLFVGDGAEREALLARSAELGLRNVTLHAPLPKERMPAVWSLCDVALVHLRDTPLFETVIPSKIFEAMGMGIPIVIACPRGEATRIVEGTGAGRVVAPQCPGELATAVDALARSPAEVARLGSAARAAAPRYSRDRLAADMLAHLECVAGLARGSAPSAPVEMPAALRPAAPGPVRSARDAHTEPSDGRAENVRSKRAA